MTGNAAAHDFLLPRLTAPVDEAVAGDVARQVEAAVLNDLGTSPYTDSEALVSGVKLQAH
jgi:hypothetical protein